MGFIRLLLAVSVVSSHAGVHPFLSLVGGTVAVKTFFIISGFYIAMIINNYKDNTSFYISRYLRLFPVYFFCFLITFIIWSGINIEGLKLFNNDELSIFSNIFILFTNIFIFFQDILMFFGVDDGKLYLINNSNSSDLTLNYFLFLPQGWTLGLELSFYLIAPLIVKKGNIKLIIFLIILSLTLRLILISFNFTGDPWAYRLFPTELALFLLGSLSYYLFRSSKIKITKNRFYLIYIVILFYTLFYAYLPFIGRSLIYFAIISLSLWFVFNKTKDSKIDRFLGELSYPIYCSHIFILQFVFLKHNFFDYENLNFFNSLTLISIIVFISSIIYFLIQIPVDHYRKKYKKKL